MAEQVQMHMIETERCGTLKVWVEGDLDAARHQPTVEGGRPVFMTVHDIGKNSNSWRNFVHHPSMQHVKDKSVFVHVDLLGQEDEAEDLKAGQKFPTMQVMGEDLVNILDNLRLKSVIGLADGAGANIMARFAAMHWPRCLGAILINPTATVATFFEQFKDKMTSKLPKFIQGSSENFLILHRFGHKMELSDDMEDTEEWQDAIQEYLAHIKNTRLNLKNAHIYVQAYMDRDDITAKMKNVQDDLLLVSGSKSSYAANMETMYSFCTKTKTSCIKIDDVADVLEEAPIKLSQSLLLFCKGMGLLTSLVTSGLERRRSSVAAAEVAAVRGGRRMSMEDYDQPNLGRLALHAAKTSTFEDESDEEKEEKKEEEEAK